MGYFDGFAGDYSLGGGSLQGLGDVGNWNPYAGSYDMGLSLSPSSGLSGLSTDIGSLNGGTGGTLGGSLFYDTQTGQFVTAQQMMQLDPMAGQQALSGQMTTPATAPPNAPSGGMPTSQPLSNAQMLGLGGAGLGTALGLAGVLQQATGAGDRATQSTTRNVAPASPGESAVTNALVQQILAGQGPYSQLTGQGQQASALQQQIMAALGPTAAGLARGQVPMTPELQRTIESAFTPQLGNIGNQAIESARQRGFAGGAELLGQGPGGAIAGPALADLQGQIAAAKLQYATGLPTQAMQILQAIGGIGGQTGALQMNQLGRQLDFLNMQQNSRLGAAGSYTNQQGYPGAPIMTAANSFGNVLGGVGGALAGVSRYANPQPQYNVSLSGY